MQEQLPAEGADPVAIAKAAGFAITTEDLNAHQSNNLPDDELEGVAGGGCVWMITEKKRGNAFGELLSESG